MNSDSFSNQPDSRESSATVVDHRRSNWTPALVIGLLTISAFSFYQYSQGNGLRRELNARQDKEAADIQSRVQSQVAEQTSALAGTVSELQEQLASTEQQTSRSIARVQDAAKRHADVVANNVEKSLEKKTADQQEALTAELAGVKHAASDTASRINDVGASVDSVKTDLESTRAVADRTAADLQRASGDMGVMSGLIATNSTQIQALRAMGDRNIYEFTIAKKAGLQKVGDVQMRLTKSDPKHNRFTVVVMADDKLIEKRDKTTNEPVQFYAAPGSRTPYEVVVNEVGKDTIKGYLATPKVATARN